MSLPSYTNLLFVLINEYLNSQNGMSINVIDLFSAFGTIINCCVIINSLYIKKIKKILDHKEVESLKKTSQI